MHSKILIGMTTALTAAAIAAPAGAQTVPAPTATQATTGATIHIDTCTVEHSRNAGGFAYASCPLVATVPEGQSVTVRYRANLKTFKPGTNGTWSKQSGTFALANTGDMPGQTPGTVSEIIGGMKLAFRGRSVAQVQKSLKVKITAVTPGVTVTESVATATPTAQGS
jgi:hypothetical protein